MTSVSSPVINTIRYNVKDENKGLTIYPNPTKDWVNISVNPIDYRFNEDYKIAEYAIYSISGEQLIRQKVDQQGTVVVDVSSLGVGVYLVKVIDDYGETYGGRLLVR